MDLWLQQKVDKTLGWGPSAIRTRALLKKAKSVPSTSKSAAACMDVVPNNGLAMHAFPLTSGIHHVQDRAWNLFGITKKALVVENNENASRETGPMSFAFGDS